MEPFDSAWSIIVASLIFIIGLCISFGLSNIFGLLRKEALKLYIWHTFFCIVYYVFVSKSGGDALVYWYGYQNVTDYFSFGTIAVVWLVKVLKLSGMSIFGAFLTFNIFGTVGLLAFYGTLKNVVEGCSYRLQRLAVIIACLPSVSFWSAGLGKDALSFMAMGLALWAALALERRKVLMIFAIAVMLYVRPHMAGIMIMALAFSILFQKNIPIIQRCFVGLIALTATAIIVPYALQYAGLGENINATQLQQYIDNRQGYNQEGGGGIDISSMSLPIQMFTYLLRPFPIEARSIPQLAASVDNIILFYLIFVGLLALVKTRGLELEGNRLFMWLYVLISWVIFSMTTANLGISIRQKWMFTPILIYLLLSILAAKEIRDRIK